VNQLFFERHCDEAIRLLQTRLAESRDLSDLERLNYQWPLSLAHRCSGDIAGARATAQQMLGPLETLCQKDSQSYVFAEGLSLVHAMLGEKDAAIKEAERAITLLPSTTDAVEGPGCEENLAIVETLVGEKDRAIPRLQHLLAIPYTNFLTPALLRLDPQWDPLRGDSLFQKLCQDTKL
jgi:hypothetical protein